MISIDMCYALTQDKKAETVCVIQNKHLRINFSREIKGHHIDVCYGLIYDRKANTVLVVQNEHGGWSFPGGAKEAHETLEQALLREVKEETDLDVEIICEIETSERYLPTHDIFHLFYVILKDEKAYGAPIFYNNDEIMRVKWVAFDEVRVYLPWYENGIHHLKDKIVAP